MTGATERLPYRLSDRIGTRATLGLVVLQVDETIEHDFQRLCHAPDVAVHVSRIPSGAALTPDTIAEMDSALGTAAALLPPAAVFDCVAYACTSGTAQLGAARVADRLRSATAAPAASDPLTAALAGLRALSVARVGLVSPYIDSVARPIRAALGAAGIAVPACVSFGEEIEARVARIDTASIRSAARQVCRASGIDAVFLSCTNLRTLDVIDTLEAELGIPVLSSNQALAWHMLAQGGLTAAPGRDAPGRLMRVFPGLPEAMPA